MHEEGGNFIKEFYTKFASISSALYLQQNPYGSLPV